MEKNRWNSEESTATQMKQVISSKKLQKTPSSPKTSGNQRYWDEGRVLKVGFLLVFVRAFARLLLRGLGTVTPVVMFLFFALLGGGTLSLMENLKGVGGAPGGLTGTERVSVGGIELYEP